MTSWIPASLGTYYRLGAILNGLFLTCNSWTYIWWVVSPYPCAHPPFIGLWTYQATNYQVVFTPHHHHLPHIMTFIWSELLGRLILIFIVTVLHCTFSIPIQISEPLISLFRYFREPPLGWFPVCRFLAYCLWTMVLQHVHPITLGDQLQSGTQIVIHQLQTFFSPPRRPTTINYISTSSINQNNTM